MAYVYVNTDADVGGDGTTNNTSSGDGTHAYNTLKIAEAGEDTTLTETLEIRCSGVAKETDDVEFASWTTYSDKKLIIKATSGTEHNGIYGGVSNAYQLETTNQASLIRIREDYVDVIGLSFKQIATTGAHNGINVYTQTSACEINIENCIVCGDNSSDTYFALFRVDDSDTNVNINNCVVYDAAGGSGSIRGIWADRVSTCNITNCTIYNCGVGIERDVGTVNVKNCAVFGNSNDFVGTINSVTYTASVDNDESGTGNFVIHGTYASLFEGYTAGDFRLKDYTSTGALIDAGDGNTGTDIIGYTWDTNDIGAFAYQDGGSLLPIKWNGIDPANIGKINGVTFSDLGSINGVS